MAVPIRQVLKAVSSGCSTGMVRQVARLPLVHEAEVLLGALPRVELVSMTGPTSFTATLSPAASRHDWSLGAGEQFVLQALIHSRQIRNAFEIGTFNGGTTRVIAEALPGDGRVVTIDLPVGDFDRTQRPSHFVGNDVGLAYEDSPAAHKVIQLRENSLRFDPTPYAGQFELVLVDGGHAYEHGVADTRSALELVAPGGIVLWDDFQPYWHGLVRGICEVMANRSLCRLAGTSLGVHVSPN